LAVLSVHYFPYQRCRRVHFSDIDIKLLLGAVLFGIGWGLAGYCSKPAFATLFSDGLDVLVFCGL
jgi:uncharacterized membrane protein YedE/YeeE